MNFVARLMVVALILVSAMAYGCDSDEACPMGTVARGPGVCQVPGELEAGRPSVAGRASEQPGGILPPSAGRGGNAAPKTAGAGGKPAKVSGGESAAEADAGSMAYLETRCGNGHVDADEMCDGNCPASCDDGNPCTVDTLMGAASKCSAMCAHRTVTDMVHGDACCPSGANARDDIDCPDRCGDGVVTGKETCDGNCDTFCDDKNSCTADVLVGSVEACTVTCTHKVAVGVSCGSSGLCSASGECVSSAPQEPPPMTVNLCGNGRLDSGETCDGDCPKSCSTKGSCLTVSLQGDPVKCTSRCVEKFSPVGAVCPTGKCDGAGACIAPRNPNECSVDDDCTVSGRFGICGSDKMCHYSNV